MSRAPLAALVGLLGIFALGPFLSHAEDSSGIAWNDSKHPEFFRYQSYLDVKGLSAHDEKEWAALAPKDQASKVDADEQYLKQWFEAHMAAADKMTPDDREMLNAVWGRSMGEKVEKLRKAAALKDPRQVQEASKAVAKLASIAGTPMELQGAAFTGEKPGAPAGGTDYFEVKAKAPYLRSLQDEKIAAVLKDQESFNGYIQSKVKADQVVEVAQPGLEAMYQVLSKAEGDEKKELSHLLPTVVRYLEDGKKIVLDDKADAGTYGVTLKGDYQTTEHVAVTPALKTSDPIFVADTLAHEFQHVYDNYTGRRSTLDSEMRGFKVNALFGRTLRRVAPEKYKNLKEGDNDDARQMIRNGESDEAAFKKSPAAFADEVAFGHGYASWSDAKLSGNVSLAQALDPENGQIRELNAMRRFAARSRERAAGAEKRLAAAAAALKKDPGSRDARTEFDKANVELVGARENALGRDADSIRLERQLRLMQEELAWLKKKDPKAKYDLFLQVDEELSKP